MINNFWNWILQSTNNALNILNRMVNDSTLAPFFALFLVVFATAMIMKFIVFPLLLGGSGASDLAEDIKYKNKKRYRQNKYNNTKNKTITINGSKVRR